ncbi:hypothetical protein HBA55_20990 [Pseudomaricurvus alkylphenolicus]|jgi:hypothetical protein|uniref:DUF6447 family protein n=1 Tax=Pseudomaricurvus alkylphenolicus TaxID=1306991 RepID=UPI00141E9D30|nr:DUF6447 family protein [Pseudomaricurvus alkylphenolicus]NIB42095.1 hypothetical protein [Pseudomaricurvus alkylphenolicus]
MSNENPATVNIDGKEFKVDDLSDNAKALIQNISFGQAEVRRLQGQLALAQTGLRTYQQALAKELPAEEKA